MEHIGNEIQKEQRGKEETQGDDINQASSANWWLYLICIKVVGANPTAEEPGNPINQCCSINLLRVDELKHITTFVKSAQGEKSIIITKHQESSIQKLASRRNTSYYGKPQS